MYVIHPVPKRYAWGSPDRLQQLFNMSEQEGQGPVAEMWFSGHSGSASVLELPAETEHQSFLTVPDAIVGNPLGMVGRRSSDEFGPVLPYLFKIISANEPLSLQVHPVDFEARAGFNEENAKGIALTDPTRSFKDTNAKNEMVVALEPFEAVVGFAPRATALRNLTLVEHPVAVRMVAALQSDNAGHAGFDVLEPSLKKERFLQAASSSRSDKSLPQQRHLATGNPAESGGDSRGASSSSTASFFDFRDADVLMPVASAVWHLGTKRIFRAFHAAITAPAEHDAMLLDALRQARGHASNAKQRLAFDYAIRAAQAFPGDVSALALLMMNPVSLQEGESVFIPTGTPHAYIHGTGAEIMTNSDNVLRAGLTVKHKDVPHLLNCLDCKPASPIDPSDTRIGRLLTRDMVLYRPGVNEFMLIYGHVDAAHTSWPVMDSLAKRYDALIQQVGGHTRLPHLGPRIVVCTKGAVRCDTERESRVLHRGQAVFVPASDGWAAVNPVTDGSASSTGSYVIASTPF
ncbi:type I phosphomannose isomerase catalytic subunit [Bifidobacterium gallicum]|uniref:Mannose-6-phosphate isomerase n=1 Tax=Bifidobacterium gallicum DSM 20093 = LMG 11596 TaxID=561180 RepID=D1NV49_9BIFI|nr:type I phosphomannose isomerase catalytic subunit [Bifidobacterium gallicum]EFA22700.1 phosphomannose isomerase type I [Bifidobacterium gallicum DSM 20093 = LMG 11596]KFI59651.1 mannose-6-phosphate isomerase [Bifidobacterium gallicum DSM 20093 = LMG 11596]